MDSHKRIAYYILYTDHHAGLKERGTRIRSMSYHLTEQEFGYYNTSPENYSVLCAFLFTLELKHTVRIRRMCSICIQNHISWLWRLCCEKNRIISFFVRFDTNNWNL